MNRYIFLHRIKGPVMILVFGLTALLDQWHILSYGKSWPLYLIALGILQLAERAAWTQAQYPNQGQWPGSSPGSNQGPYPGPYTGPNQGPQGPYPGQPSGWGGTNVAPPSSSALTITPPDMPRDLERK